MRIMMLQAFLPPASKGGVAYQAAGLAETLTRRGHAVTITSFSPKPSGALYDVIRPSIPEWFALNKACRLIAVPLAFSVGRYIEFDVVHAHGDSQFVVSGDTPTVRTFYGSALEEARNARRLRRRASQYVVAGCEHLARRRATVTVGISANTVRSVGGLDRVIPCGVDRQVFRPGPKSKHPSILFVGTLGGRKRGRLVVEAFQQVIRPANPECELWMVADEPVVMEGVRNWHRPSTERLATLYREAWLLLQASSYEGFGVPYIEAMASGTPIVTSANSGALELLATGGSGVVVDVERLGADASALLRNPARRRDMEQAGLQASDAFDWEVIADHYEDVYALAASRLAARGTVAR
jgi:phosphatidylinositol alpha-mannosyltransferase